MLDGKRAYICSPLSAKTREERLENMMIAKIWLDTISRAFHCRTFASHAYLPLMLDDTIPEERELALSIGKQLLDFCDVLLICGERISSGMKGEILHAWDTGKGVYWFDDRRIPFGLKLIKNWEELKDAVQIPEKNISE